MNGKGKVEWIVKAKEYILALEKRYLGSLRRRIILFVAMIILLFIIVIIICTNSHYSLFNHYNKTFSQYEELVRFYDNTNELHIAFKAYLQTGEEEYLESYDEFMALARADLEQLKPLNSFRFGLLDNMLDTYDERVVVAIDEKDFVNKQTHYDYLERLKQLIMETQRDNYYILTDININNEPLLKKNLQNQLIRVLVITSFVVFISFILIFNSMKSLIKPIGILVHNANKIKKGDFDVELVHHAPEEIQMLSDTFYDMASSIEGHLESIKDKSKLEKRIIEKENENLRMGKIIAETKLSIFQRQINSHFLFNTLSIISKLAYIEGAERTSELMVTTSELLRYSVEKGGKISDLYEEINCCKNYMEIQRKRFGTRINFILNIEESLPNIRMPAMLLQPIIENAVIHGVGDMIEGAMVKVDVYYKYGEIYIIIEDNGKGIEEKKLQDLRKAIDSEVSNDYETSIGIFNVKVRLSMFYGNRCTFYIDSEEEKGTKVVMTVYED
ncbi:hypothetical protein SH2C18_37190 [Clostridium sediminicola]|uniref:sensor histidine kinase n=1 Tax=Clostridium sediminicola TaxID=3114879 RepID=UPI0031F1D4DD